MIEADPVSAVLRGVHLAAMASLFGTLVFSAVVVRTPPDTPASQLLQHRLAVLVRGSLALALLVGLAWFTARAAAIAGAEAWPDVLAAVPAVALDTRFGRLLLLRLALLLALVLLCAPWRMRSPVRHAADAAATLLAAGALGLQAVIGHAGAMDNAGLVAAETLHVLAAGAWLGALTPLLILLATAPTEAAPALRRFFPLGLGAVLVIAATSVVQGLAMVGSVPALVGTGYGRLTLLKTLLFLLLLAFAALNRLVLGAKSGASLRRSIMGEAGVAALVIFAGAALSHLTPGVHGQPVWPFPWRLNPDASGPLLAAAHPTSFFVSPIGFAADAIVRGEASYQARCAACHGASAHGDGPAAGTLPTAPADLTAARVLAYGDGDLFWFAGHQGGLTEADRWDLVDYLRARNHGEFVRTAGRGVHPLRLPRFTASCGGGRVIEPGHQQGQVLRLIGPAGRPIPAVTSAVTILLAAGAEPQAAECVAQPGAQEALAILLGATPGQFAGAELLVDPNGWLRARWHPGEPGGWPTPELLSARVEALAGHPLPAGPAAGGAHHH
jgi:putative copper export protein